MKGRGCCWLHETRIAVLFLLALLFLSPAGAQESELAEAQRLNEQILQLYAAGKYQRAIPLAQRALLIRERALAPDHPDIALSLSNLGMLYFRISAYAKAKPLYERALEIREKVLGSEHPDTAVSLMNLGGLYQATGDYAKAEQLFKRALAITEKAPGIPIQLPRSTISRCCTLRSAATRRLSRSTSARWRSLRRRSASNRPIRAPLAAWHARTLGVRIAALHWAARR